MKAVGCWLSDINTSDEEKELTLTATWTRRIFKAEGRGSEEFWYVQGDCVVSTDAIYRRCRYAEPLKNHLKHCFVVFLFVFSSISNSEILGQRRSEGIKMKQWVLGRTTAQILTNKIQDGCETCYDDGSKMGADLKKYIKTRNSKSERCYRSCSTIGMYSKTVSQKVPGQIS